MRCRNLDTRVVLRLGALAFVALLVACAQAVARSDDGGDASTMPSIDAPNAPLDAFDALDAIDTACGDGPPCDVGQLCAVVPGCGPVVWRCERNTCRDAVSITFCGCDGGEFQFGGCLYLDFPYANRGPCERAPLDAGVD